jgi:predicted ATP-grasp superfamily ATP-dependent carboligase
MLPKAFLLTSLSGRILAKAAARAQQPVVGIDAFADRDTCSMAMQWARTPLDSNGAFDATAVLEAADSACPPAACLGLVYGSGLEAQPALLRSLAKGRTVLGNSPEVLETVADPVRFSDLLATLDIPHPATRMSRPANVDGWLSKRAGACGGTHVRLASASPEDGAGRYFQQQVAGEEWSFLFLANGREICPVGFNQPLATPSEATGQWSYAGATRMDAGPAGIGDAVMDAARVLAAKLGLVGLNGIDFIVTHAGWVLLELNPRPPATLELWDVPLLPCLFDLHIEACKGRLPKRLPKPDGSMTVAVIYAKARTSIHADFAWPAWCADLPWADSVIEAGDPICTVRAEGPDAASARYQALSRHQEILERLDRFTAATTDWQAPNYAQPTLMFQA